MKITWTSDSATQLATQQSIKAFVEAQVTAEDLDITTDSGTIAIDLDSETLQLLVEQVLIQLVLVTQSQ